MKGEREVVAVQGVLGCWGWDRRNQSTLECFGKEQVGGMGNGSPGRCWLQCKGSSSGAVAEGRGVQATELVAVVLGKRCFLHESSSEII